MRALCAKSEMVPYICSYWFNQDLSVLNYSLLHRNLLWQDVLISPCLFPIPLFLFITVFQKINVQSNAACQDEVGTNIDSYSSNHMPEKTIDGNRNSYWCSRDYKYESDSDNFWFYYLFSERKALKQIKIRFYYCSSIQAISILAKKDCKRNKIENLRGLTTLIDQKVINSGSKACDITFDIPEDELGSYDCVAIDWKMKSSGHYAAIYEMEFFEGKVWLWFFLSLVTEWKH